ncbi:hypothetical protein IFM89_012505 [Coptis chinensis]|uniref:ARM repeat superfamily protein n=1 Tax=Coptis chinensis TaxID=261450 RepID=A0A835HY31_9MAGN|nr:hypothetical protein IFM89_012505 [Coptis chinensis]
MDDNALQLESTTQFRKLLSIVFVLIIMLFWVFLGLSGLRLTWALTNIIRTRREHRVVIDHGAVPIFVQLLGSRVMIGKPQPPFELTKPALPVLERLIHSNDEEVLTDACYALSYLSDGTNDKIQAVIEAGVCPRLVELLLKVDMLVHQNYDEYGRDGSVKSENFISFKLQGFLIRCQLGESELDWMSRQVKPLKHSSDLPPPETKDSSRQLVGVDSSGEGVKLTLEPSAGGEQTTLEADVVRPYLSWKESIHSRA